MAPFKETALSGIDNLHSMAGKKKAMASQYNSAASLSLASSSSLIASVTSFICKKERHV